MSANWNPGRRRRIGPGIVPLALILVAAGAVAWNFLEPRQPQEVVLALGPPAGAAPAGGAPAGGVTVPIGVEPALPEAPPAAPDSVDTAIAPPEARPADTVIAGGEAAPEPATTPIAGDKAVPGPSVTAIAPPEPAPQPAGTVIAGGAPEPASQPTNIVVAGGEDAPEPATTSIAGALGALGALGAPGASAVAIAPTEPATPSLAGAESSPVPDGAVIALATPEPGTVPVPGIDGGAAPGLDIAAIPAAEFEPGPDTVAALEGAAGTPAAAAPASEPELPASAGIDTDIAEPPPATPTVAALDGDIAPRPAPGILALGDSAPAPETAPEPMSAPASVAAGTPPVTAPASDPKPAAGPAIDTGIAEPSPAAPRVAALDGDIAPRPAPGILALGDSAPAPETAPEPMSKPASVAAGTPPEPAPEAAPETLATLRAAGTANILSEPVILTIPSRQARLTVELETAGSTPDPVVLTIRRPETPAQPDTTPVRTDVARIDVAVPPPPVIAPELSPPLEILDISLAAGQETVVAALAPDPNAPPPAEAALPGDPAPDEAAPPWVQRGTGKRSVRPGETWLAYARPFSAPPDRPLIAVVITGLGLSQAATNAAIRLPSEVTLAFSSYARDLQKWIDLARASGHEVMLDVPMEPVDYPDIDPGPQALLTSLSSGANVDRLKWHLSRATGYVGITHNMGSRFTASENDMRPVLSALKVRGLLFLDSRTSSKSVAARLASKIGLARAINNRFIDAHASRPAIERRLREVERIARRSGVAVTVGHAFPVTLDRIADWVPTLIHKGFALAPISAVVNKQAVQ